MGIQRDHHKGAPYATLWENIDVGEGNRALRGFGAAGAGPHSGAYGTFYNIRARQNKIYIPKIQDDLGPFLNFIGVDFKMPSPYPLSFKPYQWYYSLNDTIVAPSQLRDCMLSRRN